MTMRLLLLKFAVFVLILLLNFPASAVTTEEQKINFLDSSFSQRTILKGSIRETIKNHSTGIGVIGLRFIHQAGYPTYIEEVYPYSPAMRAGLKKSDLIFSIDGIRTDNLNSDSVYQLLSGNPGTKVKIFVARSGSMFNIELIREDLANFATEIQNRYLSGPIAVPFDIRKIFEFD